MGTPLFPGQRYVMDVALEVQSEEAGDPEPGAWAYGTVVDTEPRRSGKTFKIGPLVAHGCGRAESHTAWITAQKRTNAAARWHDVAKAIRNTSLKNSTRIKVGNGQEKLYWPGTGNSFQPFAPKVDTMHGEEPDRVFVDELWAFDLEQKAAIEQGYEPAGLVKNLQVWLLSAAGTEASAWLNLEVKRGRAAVEAGKRLGLAYFEWSVQDEIDGIPIDEAPDDLVFEAVLNAHPRRDHGLRRQYLLEQLEKTGREDFLRAYGNRRTSKDAKTIIPMVSWRAAQTDVRIPGDARVGLAFECDPDGLAASISAGWRDSTGVAYPELIKMREGLLWVPDEIVRLAREHRVGAIAMNNAGPAKDIGDKVAKALDEAKKKHRELVGVELLRLSGAEYAAACNRYESELLADPPMATHDGDPEVTAAMRAAGRRNLGGGKVWAKRGDAPIVALGSNTLAVWAADHMPAEVPRFRIA